jgi:hypothetical protein
MVSVKSVIAVCRPAAVVWRSFGDVADRDVHVRRRVARDELRERQREHDAPGCGPGEGTTRRRHAGDVVPAAGVREVLEDERGLSVMSASVVAPAPGRPHPVG